MEWCIGSPFSGPTVQRFHDLVHREGQLLLLTGDLRAYWSAHYDGEALTFPELFPKGWCWAAWAPLRVHLYEDGVGTRRD